MEKYAPTLQDLAPRDMVSRAMYREIREGRGIDGRNFLHLDLTHLGADVIESKLPDISGFVRTYLGIDPVKEPIPVQPTAHYMMGGIPTDVHGPRGRRRAKHRFAGPLCGRRVRLRVGPRRQPPGHQFAGRHPGIRPARGPPCRAVHRR